MSSMASKSSELTTITASEESAGELWYSASITYIHVKQYHLNMALNFMSEQLLMFFNEMRDHSLRSLMLPV